MSVSRQVYHKIYYRKNKNKWPTWKERNISKETSRNYYLKSAYGTTLKAYKYQLQTQKGLCAICQQKCKTGQNLCQDHNHNTKQNRGLLCRTCNSVVAWCNEDTKTVRRLLKYLEKWNGN